MARSVFFCTFGCLPSNLNGSEHSRDQTVAIIHKIRESLNGIKPFNVEFIQQVSSESGLNAPVDVEESGEILFKNDQNLKWTYLKPDYKLFLLEGNTYRFYDQDNEQLTIGKITDWKRQWIWQLLFSNEIVRYASSRDEGNRKKLFIKHAAESLEVEILVNSDFLPIRMTQIDPSGARMTYFFKNYRPHTVIPADAFQLKIPKGVEVINENENAGK
ncbi:MAG: LolA family protein [Candidatus Omnitrophota bacterium]